MKKIVLYPGKLYRLSSWSLKIPFAEKLCTLSVTLTGQTVSIGKYPWLGLAYNWFAAISRDENCCCHAISSQSQPLSSAHRIIWHHFDEQKPWMGVGDLSQIGQLNHLNSGLSRVGTLSQNDINKPFHSCSWIVASQHVDFYSVVLREAALNSNWECFQRTVESFLANVFMSEGRPTPRILLILLQTPQTLEWSLCGIPDLTFLKLESYWETPP